MPNSIEILWQIYEHNLQQIRHFQEERRAIANTVLILAGAIIAIIGFNQTLDPTDRTMGIFLVLRHYEGDG